MIGLLCVEGPDGSGKTTLADNLLAEYGGVRLKASAKWLDRMDVYHTALLERALLLSKKKLVIMDRWWPSEYVYAPVYRPRPVACRLHMPGGFIANHDSLPTEWREYGRYLDQRFTVASGLYVFVLPDFHTALARLKTKTAKDQYDQPDEKWTRVWNRYNRLLTGQRLERERSYYGDVARSGGMIRRHNVLRLVGGASSNLPLIATAMKDLETKQRTISIRQLNLMFQ